MRPDGRSYTIWDTIRNTIEHPDLTLYLVLDEAHRGMGRAARRPGCPLDDREAAHQRRRDVPPIPVVWGISATVERFKRPWPTPKGAAPCPTSTVDTPGCRSPGC
jgi:type III restriction enzyme